VWILGLDTAWLAGDDHEVCDDAPLIKVVEKEILFDQRKSVVSTCIGVHSTG
jgi:hypothetical protein